MRVLIVEDEFLIARDVAGALTAACARSSARSARPPRRSPAEEHGCDAAGPRQPQGLSAEPGRNGCATAAFPFLVLSGYVASQLEGELARAPFMAKPFYATELVRAVKSLRDDAD